MKFYIKATIFTSFIFICLSLGLFIKNSQSNHNQVYRLFEAADYKMALAYTNELEESSNSAKFPLYKAYILREQDKLTESTVALKKALRRLKPSQNVDLAEEIHLNLLLNSFLSRDLDQFQESLSNFRPSPSSLNPHIDLFFAIEAFLNRDYQKALPIFQKHQLHHSSLHHTYFSPWMKLAFEKNFNKEWLNKHIVLCLVEESLYSLANKKLDEMLEDNEDADSVHLLRSFCYFKQSEENPCEIALTLHASALHEIDVLNLDKIRNDKDLADDLKKMVLSLQTHILRFAKTGSLDEFSLYLNSFQFFANEQEIEILAKLLIKIINELEKDTIITLLQKIEGKTLVKLLYINRQLMEEMIKKGDLENLHKTMQLMKPFNNKDFDFVASINQIATEFALTCLKGAKTELGISLLNFFSQHETDPKLRLGLAKKLVDLAKYSWLQENYEKAIKIWKIAKDFPSDQDKPLILENLEQTIFSIYKNAENYELSIPCFYAAKAVKILELNRVTLCNQKQKNRILEDATYFYSKGHSTIAREKALFILEIDPENEVANRIIGLIAYENGNFERAYAHLVKIKQPNLNILEILKQIKKE